MSKLVKELIMQEYQQRFGDVESALVVDIRELDAIANNRLRSELGKKNIRVTVIRNSLAQKAFADSPLSALGPVLNGPSALIYGESVIDVARELMEWARKIKAMVLKGAVLDGELFEGAKGVERLSTFPTREEAQGQCVQLVLSPGASLVGAVTGPGGQLVSILKSIEEKLEKGETIAKVG